MVAPLIDLKIQLFVNSFFLILENACCNGLHHFPWILMLLKVPQTFMSACSMLGIPLFWITYNIYQFWTLINGPITTNHGYGDSTYKLFMYCYTRG
jgi:hypothetical protein